MADLIEGVRDLTDDERQVLKKQDTRLVPDHKAKMLEVNAHKHWDLFYKRNETRFFKDRHWTTREFTDLLDEEASVPIHKTMLEIGCGVGNFIFPLIRDNLNFFIYACDFSPRAIEFVKSNELYNEEYVKAFQTDITTNQIQSVIGPSSVDIATLIFVLSAIHPDKFETTLKNILTLLKPNALLLIRDYGLYDMAQLRFKPGHKIAENFYMRQDGTRSFYFSPEYLNDLAVKCGFDVVSCTYIHRRTINKKENIDVPRIFIQAKLRKSVG